MDKDLFCSFRDEQSAYCFVEARGSAGFGGKVRESARISAIIAVVSSACA